MEKIGKLIQEVDFSKADEVKPAAMDPGDYVGDDGLLICGKCKTPKQARIELPGRDPFIVPAPCECLKKAEADRKKKAEEELRESKARSRRDACFAASGFYRDCTFETDDGRNPRTSDLCRRFAETFDGKDPYGLLLWGGVGTGKSFMASAIANRVIDKGFSVLQTDIGYIVNTMEASFEQRRENLSKILSHDLLIIEDLGAQRTTGYMMEYVYTVIDGRYKSGRPMIVTTNYTYKQMTTTPPSDPWCRIFDRIVERCYPVEFTGRSRRIKSAYDMRKIMEKRLGLE